MRQAVKSNRSGYHVALVTEVARIHNVRVTAISRKKAQHLAQKAPFQFFYTMGMDWQGLRDSNPRPSVLETDALPTELNP